MLVEELNVVNTKWRELGQALEVQNLDAIGRQYGVPDECLKEMLKVWMEENKWHSVRGNYNWHEGKHIPKWHDVLNALRRVGEEHLSNELKEKYGELPSGCQWIITM